MIHEKSKADAKLFQLQDETLWVELAKTEETVAIQLTEKKQVEVHNLSLSGNLDAMKVDCDALQQLVANSRERSNNDLYIFKSWIPDRDLQVTDSEMRRPIALPRNRGTTILECATERPVALPEDKGTTILTL